MRSHEERFAETKRRIAARQRKEQRRRGTIAMFSATAACLVLIVGVSFAMPGVVAGIRPGDYAGYETAASMYGGGAALGYIVIGLSGILILSKKLENPAKNSGNVFSYTIADAKEQGRKGLVLTCKNRLVHYYAKFGFADEGVTDKSTHGNVAWHQMRLTF